MYTLGYRNLPGHSYDFGDARAIGSCLGRNQLRRRLGWAPDSDRHDQWDVSDAGVRDLVVAERCECPASGGVSGLGIVCIGNICDNSSEAEVYLSWRWRWWSWN